MIKQRQMVEVKEPDVLQKRPGGHTSRRREDGGQGGVGEVEELKRRSRSLQTRQVKQKPAKLMC